MVDYSGFYISGGLVLSFIDERTEKNKNTSESTAAGFGVNGLPAPVDSNTGAGYEDLIIQGNDLFNIKDYKAALDIYNKALLQKETYEVYKKIGTCYFYLGEKPSTKGAYEKALKLNPDDAKLKDWLKNYKK
jgi:tetratricopeptide (TPR) repeat protein